MCGCQESVIKWRTKLYGNWTVISATNEEDSHIPFRGSPDFSDTDLTCACQALSTGALAMTLKDEIDGRLR